MKSKKTIKIISIFFLLMFISMTFSIFVRGIAPGTFTYTGYVRDVNGNPIQGAEVTLVVTCSGEVPFSNSDSKSGFTTKSGGTDITDSNGYYDVTDSDAYETGEVICCELSASKDGYITEYHSECFPESGSDTQDFVLEEETPSPLVDWVSPSNNALVTFPPDNNDFTFTYSAADIDYTRLYIGPTGSAPTTQFGSDYSDEGSSIIKTVDIGSSMGDLHGLVRADLRGYVSGVVEVEATRTFNFSKQISIENEFLEDGQVDLGSKLMLILYDPPGDQSYSTWTSETQVRIKNSIAFDVGVQVEGQVGVELFDSGATTKTTVDLSGGPDFAWENVFTDIEELSSSVNTAERDYVGPGYGDLYYGEYQMFLWEIYASKITYSDNTVVYSNPYIRYGIDYSDHALVSRENAPDSWLQKNPNINTALYDDQNTIEWVEENSILEGGTGYREVTHEETNSFEWGINFEFTISHQTEAKIGGTGTKVTGHFTFKYDHDHETTNSIKTLYHIQDDDTGDYFHYDVGTDKRFGVPIFRNTPNDNPLLTSKSSSPWEYNTRDYLPPESTYPTITYNTDGDNYSPSEGDTPLVELTLTDESTIETATLIYSTNNGSNWNTINMQERINDADNWYANIPSQEHGTEVLWYLYVEDDNSNGKEIKDIDDNYFHYTVINRPCEVTLISPNGGGTYQNSILIEWSGSDLDDDSLTYNLGYRTGGGSWTNIATGLTNSSYIWDISNIADSDTVSVIVYVADGFGSSNDDTSDFAFSIDNIDIPQASIDAPLASFTYQGIISIEWSTIDPDDYITGFSLYYSTNNGSNWILIDDIIVDGILTFDWNSSSIVYSTTSRLKIVVQNSLNENVESTSGIFTIDNRPSIQMNLINPNGGETVTGVHTISWNVDYTNDLIDYQIKLEYSYNGTNWELIASNLTGTSYEWDTIPLPMGTNYRIRIILTATYLGVELDPIVDISESTFTIDNNPSIQMSLINPNGGETIDNSCLVSWNLDYDNPDIIYEIKLEYSFNGSSWEVIATGLTGTSYNWNTSALPSGSNYRLRITLTASYLGIELDPIVDISESTFTIIHSTPTPTNINSLPPLVVFIALTAIAIVPCIRFKKRS